MFRRLSLVILSSLLLSACVATEMRNELRRDYAQTSLRDMSLAIKREADADERVTTVSTIDAFRDYYRLFMRPQYQFLFAEYDREKRSYSTYGVVLRRAEQRSAADTVRFTSVLSDRAVYPVNADDVCINDHCANLSGFQFKLSVGEMGRVLQHLQTTCETSLVFEVLGDERVLYTGRFNAIEMTAFGNAVVDAESSWRSESSS